MGCIALVRCVLVLRCGLAGLVWCGIRMQAEACIRINKSQAREDGSINMRNMLSIK